MRHCYPEKWAFNKDVKFDEEFVLNLTLEQNVMKKELLKVSSEIIFEKSNKKLTKSALLTKYIRLLLNYNDESYETFKANLMQTLPEKERQMVRKTIFDITDLQKMVKKPVNTYINQFQDQQDTSSQFTVRDKKNLLVLAMARKLFKVQIHRFISELNKYRQLVNQGFNAQERLEKVKTCQIELCSLYMKVHRQVHLIEEFTENHTTK
jgi:hypothetical protein